jgi:hypothetical protein
MVPSACCLTLSTTSKHHSSMSFLSIFNTAQMLTCPPDIARFLRLSSLLLRAETHTLAALSAQLRCSLQLTLTVNSMLPTPPTQTPMLPPLCIKRTNTTATTRGGITRVVGSSSVGVSDTLGHVQGQPSAAASASASSTTGACKQ